MQDLERRVEALEAAAALDAEERNFVADILTGALAQARQIARRVAALEAALAGREARGA